MPVYHLSQGKLSSLKRLHPGPELYEKEIETLIWDDPEAFTGEALFPVARQPKLPGGGRPDIVALDRAGRVVVIEVRRDVDRTQLAQCLEYAGWARQTNLQEIASLYDRGSADHRGVAAFFVEWPEFIGDPVPVTISPKARLCVVAGGFSATTKAAFDYLRDYDVGLMVVPVTLYEDLAGQRLVVVDTDREPASPSATPQAGADKVFMPAGVYKVSVADLLDADLVKEGEELDFIRPRRGEHHRATIEGDGSLKLEDGLVFTSPSAAAGAASNGAFDGWRTWQVKRLGVYLDALRQQYVALSSENDAVVSEP